ncbi:class I SAM-dependent methyltransferase [Ancylobacter sp. IITR112]|uniref:class I SAM-dependent methyltransferase n=1 Tax=Ancylobacter sp. IITR112 TaxID=3138073 RepID=UPI003529DB77
MKLLKAAAWRARQALWAAESIFDKKYLHRDVKRPEHVDHGKWLDYLSSISNKEGLNILEVGSREVTGKSRARTAFSKANYTGFDYYEGSNVDVVGDAHRLSSYFVDKKFDLIFSSACFEHFAMPWLVATEISKLLNVGGYVFVETHFSYGTHERPWNFFQFSDMGLKVLFSEALGFQYLDGGMSNPIVGRFSVYSNPYLRLQPVVGLYCHSQFLGQKVKDVPNFDWAQVDMDLLTQRTVYPPPKA